MHNSINNQSNRRIRHKHRRITLYNTVNNGISTLLLTRQTSKITVDQNNPQAAGCFL